MSINFCRAFAVLPVQRSAQNAICNWKRVNDLSIVASLREYGILYFSSLMGLFFIYKLPVMSCDIDSWRKLITVILRVEAFRKYFFPRFLECPCGTRTHELWIIGLGNCTFVFWAIKQFWIPLWTQSGKHTMIINQIRSKFIGMKTSQESFTLPQMVSTLVVIMIAITVETT